MKQRLIRILMPLPSLKFAIRREVLNNGTEILTPMVKHTRGLFNNWTAIVRVNDHYEAIDLHTTFQYTEKDCMEYIEGYKQQFLEAEGKKTQKIIFEPVV